MRVISQSWKFLTKPRGVLSAVTRALDPLRLLTAFALLGIIAAFVRSMGSYREVSGLTGTEAQTFEMLRAAWWSLAGRAVGVVLAFGAFALSVFGGWGRGVERGRPWLAITTLWVLSLAVLTAWLPGDLANAQQEFRGMSFAGEPEAVGAYAGKVALLALLNLVIPVAAVGYYRMSFLDRYVIRSFLTPFSLSMFGFIGIWAIFDYTDNGPAFAGLPFSLLLEFYTVQIPYIVLFVTPVAVLLSALYAFNGLSRSNELISMIGAGKSVPVIVAPVFVTGILLSVVCLAFKYEWAPRSVGYKEAILDSARIQRSALRLNREVKKSVWAARAWMHLNESERRGWFVQNVPLELSRPMSGVVVWQLDESGTLETVWKAMGAQWFSDRDPPEWALRKAMVYQFDEERVPRITTHNQLVITDWNETPWTVLSSSQVPEHLGIPGLSRYLKAHAHLDGAALAPFRTSWWYVFAEPFGCMAMVMVAVPLGIVYSRRGAMAGVTGAIILFALMYVSRETLLAMGQASLVPPFWAAWGTNLFIGAVGVVLLWFRSKNREMPTVKGVLTRRSSPS